MSDNDHVPTFDDTARSELYEQRILVLDGQLDDDNGTLLATQLIALSVADRSADIALWVHSPGGSVPAMLAIRDLIKLEPNTVPTLTLGIAYSAGQFLLTAGAPGHRRVLPHTRLLMHQYSAGIGGAAMDVELQAGDLRHTRETVLGLTAKGTGLTVGWESCTVRRHDDPDLEFGLCLSTGAPFHASVPIAGNSERGHRERFSVWAAYLLF